MRDSVHLAKWTLSGRLVSKRRRRRKWSDDEKRLICAQTRAPGISVAQVAHRYGLNANQVFNWRKDPRYAADGGAVDEARFLPVEIIDDEARPAGGPSAPAEGSIAIDLAGGHRVRISGCYDPDALARLLRGLMG